MTELLSPGETSKNVWARNHLVRDAIGRALYDAMKQDPSVFLFGEGARMKMKFDAPKILEEFPERILTLPIQEDGNTNFAVGASLAGVKPVVDVITADFLYRTMDSICNTAAKLNFVTGNQEPPKTIVIRSEFYTGGPTTGQRPEAFLVHVPGINVVVPSTPKDAYGLMRTALMTPGVTVFFEDRMIKDSETLPSDYDQPSVRPIEFGKAAFRSNPPNPEFTIITYGLARQMVEKVLGMQEILNVDLIDLRTLYPLDWQTIYESVNDTQIALIVEPDITYGGVGAEIAAFIAENTDADVKRVGAKREVLSASSGQHHETELTEESIRQAFKTLYA